MVEIDPETSSDPTTTPPEAPRPVPPPNPSSDALRLQTNLVELSWGKKMQTTVTLYRDGNLVISPYTQNDNWTGGLSARVLVVIVDAAGQAICVTQDWGCTTRCSVPDFGCASRGTDMFSEQFPAAIGRYAYHLDVYQAETPSFVDLRNQFITAIKSLVDIAPEVKGAIEGVFN